MGDVYFYLKKSKNQIIKKLKQKISHKKHRRNDKRKR